MRKLKFRAWDKVPKRMLSPVDIFNEPGMYWEDTPEGELQLCRVTDSFGTRQYLELMQFTELYDMNGKEIYETDVLLGKDDEKRTVSYLRGSFGFEDEGEFYNLGPVSIYFEVIGNRFENGDLMKWEGQRKHRQ